MVSAPVYSMTGSGVATGDTELGTTAVELRTVNGRNLSIKTRLSSEYQGLESAFDALLRKGLQRGSASLVIQLTPKATTAEVKLDAGLAQSVATQLRALAAQLGSKDELRLTEVLAFPGVITSATNNPRTRISWQPPADLLALVQQALQRCQESRQQEGAKTLAAVQAELQVMATALAKVQALAPKVVERHRQRLLQRVNEFLQGRAVAMEDRDVLKEVALYADRADIAEEMQRLQAHLDKVQEVLQAGGPVGRKLEFLLQEMLREANTMGSKSPEVEISHSVVQMKACMDKLKEQAANLE